MIPKDNCLLKSVRKLNFPCPFCGEDLFSTPCINGEFEYIDKSELCLVLEDHGEELPESCYVFCYFICNKRKIEIDIELITEQYMHPDKDVYCSDINRVCSNIFRNLFSLIPIDKGFKI